MFFFHDSRATPDMERPFLPKMTINWILIYHMGGFLLEDDDTSFWLVCVCINATSHIIFANSVAAARKRERERSGKKYN